MPSQWHTSIQDKSHSHDSQTRKYSPGHPFELYVLKQGKICKELGDTLQEAFPEHHQVAAAFAVKKLDFEADANFLSDIWLQSE